MNTRRARLLSGVVFAALALGVLPFGMQSGLITPLQAHAQNMGMRTVSGSVLDDASNPVSGATVFLKNEKTKSIRSCTSLANGHFFFAQVNMIDDYDLWAEKGGKKSASKTVSSWDSRTQFVTDLKIK